MSAMRVLMYFLIEVNKHMVRLIILFVLLAVSFYVVKLVKNNWKDRSDSGKPIANNSKPDEKMVQCLCCGVYLPEKKSIKQGDKVFCSRKHAKQYKE